MKLMALFAALLLTACSSTHHPDAKTGSLSALHTRSEYADLARHAPQRITANDLLTGDLLLSSATSVQSWGIRLFSLTGVSHASIYIGDGEVAEAVGSGVKLISVEEAIDESNNIVAFRVPNFSPAQAKTLRQFALQHQGEKYNFKGIVMFMPFMLTRHLCELPMGNRQLRNNCLTALASVQLGEPLSTQNGRFFCSEFVLEGYRQAGVTLFEGAANWYSPADLLHIREGDASSWNTQQSVQYVGHLKEWDLREILKLRTANQQGR